MLRALGPKQLSVSEIVLGCWMTIVAMTGIQITGLNVLGNFVRALVACSTFTGIWGNGLVIRITGANSVCSAEEIGEASRRIAARRSELRNLRHTVR